MAIIATISNHAKYQFGKKLIDLSTDTLIAILMNDTFTFEKDTHSTLAAVTANQLATKNGYSQDAKVLTSLSWIEDDTNDKGVFTCENITWTATSVDDGTGIGPTGAFCIVDLSTIDDTVICCFDFGTDHTINDESGFQLQTIKISLT